MSEQKTVIVATIKPQHLNDIFPGRKKLWEIRKTKPKLPLPFDVLCVESGSKGTIKAQFTCDSIVEWDTASGTPCPVPVEECCVSESQMLDYAAGKKLYFWHVAGPISRGVNIHNFGIERTPQSWCHALAYQLSSGTIVSVGDYFSKYANQEG